MMHYMEVVPYVTIARPYLHLIPVCTGSKLIIVVNFILSVQPYLTLISRSYQSEEQCNQQYNTKHADNHSFFHCQDHVKGV